MQELSKSVTDIPSKSQSRLLSIDYYKGICIFWICASHLCTNFLLSGSLWFWRFLFLGFECMGSASFLFCMGLTITYSVRSKSSQKVDMNVIISVIRKKVIPLWIFASIEQLCLWVYYKEQSLTPIYSFFRWDILQTLAFAPIFVVLCLNRSKITRLIISIIGLLVGNMVYLYLSLHTTILSRILIPLFFYPMTLTPLIPMIFYGIIASVCMDLILKYRESKPQLQSILTVFISFGIVLIIISILTSPFDTNTTFLDDQTPIISDIIVNPSLYFIRFIPNVLIVNSTTNYFLRMGIVIIFYSIIFYFLDYRSMINPNTRMNQYILFWGRYSLSYFIYLSVFALIPFQCNEYAILLVTTMCLLALTGVLYILINRYHGIGTVEWVLYFLTVKGKH